MMRKKTSKKVTRNTARRKNILEHKKLILVFCLSFFLSLFVFQSQAWFFFSTGKERVDFARETGAYDPKGTTATFLGTTIAVPQYEVYADNTSVLGETNGANKRIEVDLTNQKLYAFEGDKKVYEFPVSTGKYGTTPTGTFQIWIKLQSTRMQGGNKALGTYYNLPNVPFTMYFYNDQVPKWKGFGIHGAYWHNNFGHPMSHGCVNLHPDNARTLYLWANPVTNGKWTTYASEYNPGTPVVIYGTTPQH
jgi:lipoprotein-anchoring transpeptidase ErfK/SrfK